MAVWGQPLVRSSLQHQNFFGADQLVAVPAVQSKGGVVVLTCTASRLLLTARADAMELRLACDVLATAGAGVVVLWLADWTLALASAREVVLCHVPVMSSSVGTRPLVSHAVVVRVTVEMRVVRVLVRVCVPVCVIVVDIVVRVFVRVCVRVCVIVVDVTDVAEAVVLCLVDRELPSAGCELVDL